MYSKQTTSKVSEEQLYGNKPAWSNKDTPSYVRDSSWKFLIFSEVL